MWPKGFSLLFFTELWERFGFYTLQTLLVLYLTQNLFLSDERAFLIYGAFSALIYLTPVAGGEIADRLLGHRYSVIVGGILFILGYSITALASGSLLFWGLSIVVVANGFFKPNVSTMVGELYRYDDSRRDSGFTLFYMGINIGSLLPPLLTGVVVQRYGWHWGFLLAAIGMSIGMFIFTLGRARLKDVGVIPSSSLLLKKGRKRVFTLLILSGSLIATISLIRLIFDVPRQASLILGLAFIITIALVVRAIAREKGEVKERLIACLILILVSVIFWAFYGQIFSSLMLLAQRNMEKEFLGFPFYAESTPFFNPLYIILLSPLFSQLWRYLEKYNLNPSTATKFFFGMFFMALTFLFLGSTLLLMNQGGHFSPSLFAISYLFQTIGELMLSPIGLAMITRLAPKDLSGLMMGVWFLMQSVGFMLGSYLATFTDVPANASLLESLSIYAHTFVYFGVVCMGFSLACCFLIPYLKKKGLS